MGTGSFPGVKRPGRGVDHPPPSSSKVKERVELYLYSPSGPNVACSRVNFTFTFNLFKYKVSHPTGPKVLKVFTVVKILVLFANFSHIYAARETCRLRGRMASLILLRGRTYLAKC